MECQKGMLCVVCVRGVVNGGGLLAMNLAGLSVAVKFQEGDGLFVRI